MITKITKKEYKRVRSLSKLSSNKSAHIVFLGVDGKAYKTDQPGMMGAKEIHEWNLKLKKELTAQESLL